MIFTNEVWSNDLYTRWILRSTPLPQLVSVMIQLWVFLWHLRTSRLKKVLLQRGHTNLTPSVPFTHGHWWWPVRLMAPLCNLQPGTDILTWYPPFGFSGVAYGPVCLSSGAGVAAGEADDSGLACGIWGLRSCGLLRGVDWEMVELGVRQDLFTGGWEGRRAGAWGDSPQEPIDTFCLWSCYCLPHFSPPLCL